jgi:hypothetical protein
MLSCIAANSYAEGIGLFGPTATEAKWLLVVPLAASFFMALYMLFSIQTFAYLFGAIVCFAMWVAVGVNAIGSVGLLMLLFAPWALFTFVLVSLFLVIRSHQSTATPTDT